MRAAGKRLIDFYTSQLGQDVIETGLGAAASAGYQALATDMTPEEIAVSTALGIGGAAVGRPLVGRISQGIGTRIARNSPEFEKAAREMLNEKLSGDSLIAKSLRAKLAPYEGLPATAQLGQVFGRQYGDNFVQALVGLGAPLLISGDEVNA